MFKLQEYMTIKEAAAFLGVCTNTLRNWGATGKIKERRNPANGYRLFRRADLENFLRDAERPVNRNRKAK